MTVYFRNWFEKSKSWFISFWIWTTQLYLYSKSNSRSSFFIYRRIPQENILTREQGRLLAQEIGAVCYYEVSTRTDYGMDFIFKNICRIALMSRRRELIWMNKFTNIAAPGLQVGQMLLFQKLKELSIKKNRLYGEPGEKRPP